MNPRQMKQAMKKLGIQQKEIAAEQVIIIKKDERIIIDNPSVQKVNMMGQWTYQISGDESVEESSGEAEVTEEDIATVMEQAECSEEEAKDALEEANGDIAQAIMNLHEK